MKQKADLNSTRSMTSSGPSVQHLLAQGDCVAFTNGLLTIRPASGRPVPESWLIAHGDRLIKEILTQMGLEGLVFESYTTGRFGPQLYSGVTLQFTTVLSSDAAYAIFNANLDRARTTSKGSMGSPLPKRQFRVGKRTGFYEFWRASGLDIPQRLSSFHDYMGNLKNLIFTGSFTKGEKLNNKSLRVLSLSHSEVSRAFGMNRLSDKAQTIPMQHPDKNQTTSPYNKTAQLQSTQSLQQFSTTSESNYVTRLKGSADTRGNVIHISNSDSSNIKRPQDQSIEQWVAEL